MSERERERAREREQESKRERERERDGESERGRVKRWRREWLYDKSLLLPPPGGEKCGAHSKTLNPNPRP